MIIRQFDDLSAGSNDHNGGGKPWLPCDRQNWCGKFHAQWPASVINAKVRYMYYGTSRGGMLLNGDVLKLFCVYNDDGNSMAHTCGGGYGNGKSCIPGCYPAGQQCQNVHHSWSCSWPPSHLKEAMRAQLAMGHGHATRHNEFVVDTRSVEANLPHALLGFFYAAAGGRSVASRVRGNFMRTFGLSAEQVPLVHLNLHAPSGVEAFTLDS